MAQTRSIFIIENYSDRGPRQRRATIEIYQLSQDSALGLFTSRTRITLGLDCHMTIRDTTQKTGL